MNFNHFRRLYDLDMLPTNHTDINIGDLAWKAKAGRPKLTGKRLPVSIYSIFLNNNSIGYDEWVAGINYFESIEALPANIGNIDIETTYSFGKNIGHPITKIIHNQMNYPVKHRFGFTKIRTRIIPNNWRQKIQYYLSNLSASRGKEIFNNKQYPLQVISELYYGNLTYRTNRKGSEELDLLLRRTSRETVNRYLDGKVRVYEFHHHDVPFAMRLEPLETFLA